MSGRSGRTFVPLWLPIFLVVVSLIALYDFSYIFLFPASGPDGEYGKYFPSHHDYADVDPIYAAPHLNRMVQIVIGPMGIIEIALNFTVATLFVIGSPATLAVALVANVYIIAKTCFYIVYDYPEVVTTDLRKLLLLYIIPMLVWIIFPSIAIFQLGHVATRLVSGDVLKKQN
mmetsp:Transcript_34886/g.137861  ORF Transcript_34886/g.137861 Transcript_34886/m.137861 type:complete len:173 (-) Transcript_34886:319-837(-)